MSKITDCAYYHGTVLKYAKQIAGDSKHPAQHFRISNKIGSLGRGAYAFCESKRDALHFAWKTYRKIQRRFHNHFDTHAYRPCVLKFRLNRRAKVLDFTNPVTVNTFNDFTSNPRSRIGGLIHQHDNRGKVQTLDGLIADTFLNAVRNAGLGDYLGVFNPSQNEVSPTVIPDSRLPNSIELCIKSNRIIDWKSVHII